LASWKDFSYKYGDYFIFTTKVKSFTTKFTTKIYRKQENTAGIDGTPN